eukprot:TRINITY_DN6461_c0_g4_i1.p1 TRINITY_DN6461_c0_g4~~TRINITY_DN6461_c0_g4_i1.p1  ORF type:complete len:303 (+),score=63.64 TRINITY_DN6461_c0_g4_i1:62-970(+)
MCITKPRGIRAYKNNQLWTCRCVQTPLTTLIIFYAVSFIFIIVGAVLLSSNNLVLEYKVRYDDQCRRGNCTVEIDIEKDMRAPVYLYYHLEHYYQNHRLYLKSRSDAQLYGLPLTPTNLAPCRLKLYANNSTKPEDIYFPCGLIASSFFNDTFALSTSDDQPVELRKKGIAWNSDVALFKNPPANSTGPRVIEDITDEDFIVWMRAASTPNFRKLYRIIDNDLPKGTYKIHIGNNYPVASFNGEKSVIIATTSWFGQKNPFLGSAYLVYGFLTLFTAIFFNVQHSRHPRKYADTQFLHPKNE